jgi:PTS system fructose-specific IIC component
MMGGLFAFPVMKNVWPGAVLSVAVGTLVTIVMLAICRKTVTEDKPAVSEKPESIPVSVPAAQPVMQAAARPEGAVLEAIDTEDDLDIHIEYE